MRLSSKMGSTRRNNKTCQMLSDNVRNTVVTLSKEGKDHRFQEQWLGHLFAKTFATVVNLIALGLAFWYWEFGSEWEIWINHGLFGTIPVHIMAIFVLTVATKFSREMTRNQMEGVRGG
nr:uncharacterized protein LOC106685034 isoform X2 [Halyomorpha halys]